MQEKDWVFFDFELYQIDKMKDGRVVRLTNGLGTTGAHDLSDRCFPLAMDIKVISDEFALWQKVLRQTRHPNMAEIHCLLAQQWAECCRNKDDPEFIRKQYRNLEAFTKQIQLRCELPPWKI